MKIVVYIPEDERNLFSGNDWSWLPSTVAVGDWVRPLRQKREARGLRVAAREWRDTKDGPELRISLTQWPGRVS